MERNISFGYLVYTSSRRKEFHMGHYQKLIVVFLFCLTWASGVNGESSMEGIEQFLFQDTRLKEKLELKDAQEGFVGVAGDIWTIEPSGSWHVARFVNDQVFTPHLSGHLSQRQIIELAEILLAQEFHRLPAQFGHDIKINRHLISVSFGAQQSTLILNPGEPSKTTTPRASDLKDSKWENLLAIVDTIKSLTTGS
jgi:hypothetical protein